MSPFSYSYSFRGSNIARLEQPLVVLMSVDVQGGLGCKPSLNGTEPLDCLTGGATVAHPV